MSGVKSVFRHEEASAGGGSFAPQGGLIARQSLAICVSRKVPQSNLIALVKFKFGRTFVFGFFFLSIPLPHATKK